VIKQVSDVPPWILTGPGGFVLSIIAIFHMISLMPTDNITCHGMEYSWASRNLYLDSGNPLGSEIHITGGE
jgi:hypothetical protein